MNNFNQQNPQTSVLTLKSLPLETVSAEHKYILKNAADFDKSLQHIKTQFGDIYAQVQNLEKKLSKLKNI
jgi:hypothetical protein